MKKYFLLLLLAVASYESAYAQFVNNGKVIDKKGKPISGATVRGKGLMSSTTSNMDGSFSFETTLPIKQIEASYMGRSKTKKRTDYTVITLGKGSGSSGSLDNHPWFVNAQVAINDNGEYNGVGLMTGYAENWGCYLNLLVAHDNYMVTGGVIKTIAKGIKIFIGCGLAEHEEHYYAYYNKSEFAADAGFLFKISRFTANIGIASDFDKTNTFRIGLGYSF